MVSDELMLKVENVSKIYKLGEIGGTTLRDELQRLGARIRKKEDPTKKIGAKNYNKGEKFKALDNISFEVKKGERIGIIGHNGAGKSTLLKLISRVTGPTEGNIYLNGRVASMLEVGTGFHPELTGRENIYMNGAILGMTKKEIDAKMDDIIEFSEVRQFIDTPVKRYSSGMYVKLAFSVAAHLDSEIMIMDEVLAVGDVAFQNKCLTKMRDVSEQENRTILYVSHNMATIRALCNRVIVLSKGNVIFDGNVEDGISAYLSNSFGDAISFNLTAMSRPSFIKQEIELHKVEYLEASKPIFERSKNILIKIDLSSNKVLENLKLRLILRNSSDIAVGTSISDSFGSICKGESKSLVFEFDTSLLVKGKYFVSIAVISIDSSGNDIIYDHVTRAFAFEIIETVRKDDTINGWEQIWWGNIHYPNLIYKKDYEF